MEYVISHHLGSVISMSLGAAERTFPSVRRSCICARRSSTRPAAGTWSPWSRPAATTAPRADAERQDRVPHPADRWPASDPLVIAVGGTQLGAQSPGTATAPATAWPQSGGGRSVVFARPRFQNSLAGIVGRTRAMPDISMDASCDSGLEMYATPGSVGLSRRWNVVCGTSLAAPLFAGVVALADQRAGRPLGPINPLLYQLAEPGDPGIMDVRGRATRSTAVARRSGASPRGPAMTW